MNPSNTKYRLIVEGTDDQYTVINLTAKHGIDWNDRKSRIEINNAGGCEEALKAFPIAIRFGERIGIILDADLNVANRWQSVCDHLKIVAKELEDAIDLPNQPHPTGTIIELGKRRVGIWLMPDNEQSGKLEDFLKTLVPTGDGCWDYAGAVTQEAHQKGARFSKLDTIKAHIHTWLAWQKEPGRPFGTAINAAYFSHDTPEALAFVDWFKRLFLE